MGAELHRPPLDGPSSWEADVAISGAGPQRGGLLSALAYSIFAGPTGAIDEELSRRGSLSWFGPLEEAQRFQS
jgi:hypothetical protein